MDAEVYRAVAELEDEAGGPRLHDVARRAGLEVEQAREVLGRLAADRGLLHEVPDTTEPDLGPVYELSPRT